MSQVKGQVIRQRQDRKCPWAAILITEISVADNRLGISSQWFNGAELSRFTPANASNSANHLPVSRIEFTADRSCNYVRELALDNKLVASES